MRPAAPRLRGTTTVKVDADLFGLIGDAVAQAVTDTVTEAAFAIEQRAKYGIVTQNAVDTGALMNSVYTQTAMHDGRDSAISDASAAALTNGRHSGAPHPKPFSEEVATEEVKGEGMTAKVGVAAEYGFYIEEGTPRTTARPFLRPAAETVRGLIKEMARKRVAAALKAAT